MAAINITSAIIKYKSWANCSSVVTCQREWYSLLISRQEIWSDLGMSSLACLGKQKIGVLCCSCCDPCELLCLLSTLTKSFVLMKNRILTVDDLVVMGKDELLAGATPHWKTLLCLLCLLKSNDSDAFLILAWVEIQYGTFIWASIVCLVQA